MDEAEKAVDPAAGPTDAQIEAGLARMSWVTWLLDEAFPVPGTDKRVGIDGVLGLIPGAGDALTAIFQFYLLMEASWLGVDRPTRLRMLRNILVDTIVGCIPLVGDIFDFVFKAGTMNLALTKDYLGIEPDLDAADVDAADVDAADAGATADAGDAAQGDGNHAGAPDAAVAAVAASAVTAEPLTAVAAGTAVAVAAVAAEAAASVGAALAPDESTNGVDVTPEASGGEGFDDEVTPGPRSEGRDEDSVPLAPDQPAP